MQRDPAPALKETPSQTAGPYVHIGMTPNREGIRSAPDLGSGPLLGQGEQFVTAAAREPRTVAHIGPIRRNTNIGDAGCRLEPDDPRGLVDHSVLEIDAMPFPAADKLLGNRPLSGFCSFDK